MRSLTNLDVLRTFAILLVLLDHTLLVTGVQHVFGWRSSDIGLFGVYLFFVHTSLVLMWSLERRPNVLDFYIRRAFRIYPLAMLAVLLTAFSHIPVSGFFATAQWTVPSLLVNLLLMNEVVKHYVLVYGITWSLGPEVLMYLLLPALFFYARAVKRVWPLLVLWLVVVLYEKNNFHVTAGNFFYNMMPDFLAGVMAYVAFMRSKARIVAWVFPLFLVVLFLIFMGLHSIRGDWPLCLLAGLMLPYFHQLAPGWLTRCSHQIAEHSYGIYLLHPFGIWLGFRVLSGLPWLAQFGVFLATTAIFSVLSYRYFEKPMILFGAKTAARIAAETPQRPIEELEPAP